MYLSIHIHPFTFTSVTTPFIPFLIYPFVPPMSSSSFLSLSPCLYLPSVHTLSACILHNEVYYGLMSSFFMLYFDVRSRRSERVGKKGRSEKVGEVKSCRKNMNEMNEGEAREEKRGEGGREDQRIFICRLNSLVYNRGAQYLILLHLISSCQLHLHTVHPYTPTTLHSPSPLCLRSTPRFDSEPKEFNGICLHSCPVTYLATSPGELNSLFYNMFLPRIYLRTCLLIWLLGGQR